MADNRIQSRLASMEEAVSKLDQHTSAGLIAPKLHAELRALAASFGEETPSEPVAAAAEEPVASAAPVATPSVDALQANSTLADEVLATVETTSDKIDRLVAAGRKFNASRAKDDLYGIANKVAEIINNVDLAQAWVQKDLQALADDANKIHSLFASAKV